MLACAGAMLMFSVMSAFAKYLSETHSVVEIAFYRNVIASLPFLAMAFLLGRRDILKVNARPGLVVCRSVMGTFSLIATFAAYSAMPMADTSVLLFTASLFLPVLGVLFLGERVGWIRASAVLIGFVGVAIMANPSGDASLFGVSMALTAALMQAIMAIILRQLGGSEKPETVSLYFFLIGAVLTGFAMPFVATPPSAAELPLLLGVGAAGACAQFLYAVALKLTPAAIVAVLNYTSIIWATMLGWLVWNEWPLPVVLVGSAVVIGANALIAWRESRVRSTHAPQNL
ncbi:MAG: DMT family transporter [Pseudomonadota bacterium]